MFAVVCALGLLVVGVSLIAVPPDAPAASRTQVAGIFVVGTTPPSPRPAPARTQPSPAAQPATPAVVPIALSGPSHISPWTRAIYRVTFVGTGSRAVDIWWTGAAMGDWTWQRIDGHCDLTPSRDRLSGTVQSRVVIELELTPSGAPGGTLEIEGRVEGGPTYALGVVTVS